MTIHLATAFFRKYLLKTHIKNMKQLNIQWYPVCDNEDIKAFDDYSESWIHPILCDPLQSHEHAVRKLNNFLDSVDIIDNDYYCFMGDDDSHEPGFFDVIRQQTSKIIYVSLSRGNAIPDGAHPHPVYPLIIRSLNDVKIYNIGLCQFIIKGDIARHIRFQNLHNYDDGIFAEELKTRWPNDCLCLPDVFAFGNYYEPGRYTNDNWKLKTNWVLPEVID